MEEREYELVKDKYGRERKLYTEKCIYCSEEFKTYNIVRKVCSRCASLKRKEVKRLESYETFLNFKRLNDTSEARELYKEKKSEVEKFLKLEEEWQKYNESPPKFLEEPEEEKEGEDYKIVTLKDGTKKKAFPRQCVLCNNKFYSSYDRKICSACYKFYRNLVHTIHSYEEFITAFNLKDDTKAKEKYILHVDNANKFKEIYGEWTINKVLEDPSQFLERAEEINERKKFYKTESPPSYLRRMKKK